MKIQEANPVWCPQTLPVAGVGLIPICNSGSNESDPLILILQEKTDDPTLGKWADSWTFPMETLYPRENVQEGISRLVLEELGGLSFAALNHTPAGLYQFASKWLMVFWGYCADPELPPLKCDEDVKGHRWQSLSAVLGLPLRTGAREPLLDLQQGRREVICSSCAQAKKPR